MTDPRSSSPALRHVDARRVETNGAPGSWIDEEIGVVVEAPITIDVDGIETYTLLCTPLDTEALALGFLFTEGVIDGPESIVSLAPCEDDAALIRVKLHDRMPRISDEGRNLLIVSSCGLCGAENLDRKLASMPRVGDALRLPCAVLRTARQALRERQTLFSGSGGSHAAGLFTTDGTLLAMAEDAGRHNALDKAIGKCLEQGIATAGCGAVLSGRTSLEMVSKCARAGIELVSAVSAPTSLAIDVAEHCDITLCGFVREERATVFSHPRRVLEATPTT